MSASRGNEQANLVGGFYLIYNGYCSYCRFFKRLVTLLDFRRVLRPVELGSDASRSLLRGLDWATSLKSFHLVGPTGTILSGEYAVPELLSLLSGSRVASTYLASRRVRSMLHRSYTLLARITSNSRCELHNGSSDFSVRDSR